VCVCVEKVYSSGFKKKVQISLQAGNTLVILRLCLQNLGFQHWGEGGQLIPTYWFHKNKAKI
jgi:hypothetical protein